MTLKENNTKKYIFLERQAMAQFFNLNQVSLNSDENRPSYKSL